MQDITSTFAADVTAWASQTCEYCYVKCVHCSGRGQCECNTCIAVPVGDVYVKAKVSGDADDVLKLIRGVFDQTQSLAIERRKGTFRQL